jgi:hypothetical protein
MVSWNTLLRRQVAEHRRLLMIGTAHKTILYDYVLAAKPPTYFFRSLLVLLGHKNIRARFRST